MQDKTWYLITSNKIVVRQEEKINTVVHFNHIDFVKHVREGKRRVQKLKLEKIKSKKIRCTGRKLLLGNNYCMICRRFILGMVLKFFY